MAAARRASVGRRARCLRRRVRGDGRRRPRQPPRAVRARPPPHRRLRPGGRGRGGGAGAGAARARAERSAVALALLRGAGLQAAFGSDGKALQVGLSAAAGVAAANLAAGGASVPLERAADGFEQALGGRFAEPGRRAGRGRELDQGVSVLPADALGDRGRRRRPAAASRTTARRAPALAQAAPYDVPEDGLQAKFSLPYTVAFTLLHGPPDVESFRVGRSRRRRAGRPDRGARPTSRSGSPRRCCTTATRSWPGSRRRSGRRRGRCPRSSSPRRSGRWPATAWTARSTTRAARPATCSGDRPLGGRRVCRLCAVCANPSVEAEVRVRLELRRCPSAPSGACPRSPSSSPASG